MHMLRLIGKYAPGGKQIQLCLLIQSSLSLRVETNKCFRTQVLNKLYCL